MKMIPWLASTVASYVGWFLFAKLGMFAGIMGSIVGAGVGLYYGTKWVRENLG